MACAGWNRSVEVLQKKTKVDNDYGFHTLHDTLRIAGCHLIFHLCWLLRADTLSRSADAYAYSLSNGPNGPPWNPPAAPAGFPLQPAPTPPGYARGTFFRDSWVLKHVYRNLQDRFDWLVITHCRIDVVYEIEVQSLGLTIQYICMDICSSCPTLILAWHGKCANGFNTW